ncbi:MAG: Lrp/AsnC family transcriptional regulator [Candidatus Acidiferrales bacterium]
MDEIDIAILTCLQEDATMPVADVADRCGLSPSPCWRRIQALISNGTILRRVALLDPAKINAGVNLFVSIRTSQHSEAWATKFCRAAAQIPEVVEFYRMTGDVDYLLRVVVPNIAASDDFYKRLIKTAELSDVSSSFAMETIKYTTALPLEYVQKGSMEAEPRQTTKRLRRKLSRNAKRP